MPVTIEAVATRAAQHVHACYGCSHAWVCANTYCVDPEIKWCRHWCAQRPPTHPLLKKSEALQDAYHLLDQAAYVLHEGGAFARKAELHAVRGAILADIVDLEARFRTEVGTAWLVAALATVAVPA